MSELRTSVIKTPQLRALVPLRVQAAFFYCDGIVLLVLEGDGTLCHCVAFYNFHDALQSALNLGLIPQSVLERVQNYPLGPETPVVVADWVACNKNALSAFQICDTRYNH